MDLANTLYHKILANSPDRISAEHLLRTLLDTLDTKGLVHLMSAQPGLTGLTFTHHQTTRWLGETVSLDTPTQVLLWHRHRQHDLHRNSRLTELQDEIAAAREAHNRPLEDALMTETRLIELDLLTRQRRALQRAAGQVAANQRREDPLSETSRSTPEMTWYRVNRPRAHSALVARRERIRERIRDLRASLPPGTAPLPYLGPLQNPLQDMKSRLRTQDRVIDKLVSRDQIRPLLMLRRLGLFNPLGFTRKGVTFLAHAVEKNARRVARYIASQYSVVEFLGKYATAALLPTERAAEAEYNHLDLLLLRGWEAPFWEMWRFVRPQLAELGLGASEALHGHTREVLCTLVSAEQARELLLRSGLNLASLVPDGNDNPYLPWSRGGTAWHVAAGNGRHVDFLDFLFEQIPEDVNEENDDGRQALDIAVLFQRLDVARRLVGYGHRVNRQMNECLLEGVPELDDEWFWLFLESSNAEDFSPGAATRNGSYLHCMIRGLQRQLDEIAQLRGDNSITQRESINRKRRLMRRVLKLIGIVRNGKHPINMQIGDQDFNTAEELASELKLWEALYALQEKPQMVSTDQGRGRGCRYGLRDIERKNYRYVV